MVAYRWRQSVNHRKHRERSIERSGESIYPSEFTNCGSFHATLTAFVPPPAATVGDLSQRACELWTVPCESFPASAGLELTAPFLQADHLRLSGRPGDIPRFQLARNSPCPASLTDRLRLSGQKATFTDAHSYGYASAMGAYCAIQRADSRRE